MQKEITKYLLHAELKNEGARFTDISQFEYVLQVFESEKRELSFTDALFNRMHDDDFANSVCYRINIYHSILKLSDRLKKATDFIRRNSYLYDSMEFTVDHYGVVREINNAEELKKNWAIIKKQLAADYKGEVVDTYLKTVDDEIDQWHFMNAVSNYLIYGLLFSGIPSRHGSEWTGERQIIISRYEEMMTECVSYAGENNEIRQYNVTGRLNGNSALELKEFDGSFYIPAQHLLPSYAVMDIKYCNRGVANTWKFQLEKY